MKSDKQVITEPFDHLEMLKRPHLWPAWPRLPMKRHRNSVLEVAIAIEGEGNIVQFLEGVNIYMEPDTWPLPMMRTPEDIIADGWKVD